MPSWRAQFLERNPEYGSRRVVARTRYATVVELGRRERQLLITGLPQHYLDGDDWREIDPTLIDRGGKWGGRGIPVLIAPDGAVEIEGTDYAQWTSRIGLVTRDPATGTLGNVRAARVLSTTGSRADATLIRTATGGVEQHLRLHEGGLSEHIILTQAPPGGGDANDYLVIETVVAGVTLPDGDRGDWAAHGFRFPPPVAWDATYNLAPIIRRARNVGGELRLYTAIPVSWLAQAAYPVIIDPDFTAHTGDASIVGSSTTYSTARSTASSHGTTETNINIGQTLSGSTRIVYRGVNKFYTAGIPAGSITGVVMSLAAISDSSTTDFDLQIAQVDWSAEDPIDASNRDSAFDKVLAGTLDATWRNTSGMATNTPYDSPALSAAYINTSGYTRYGLRSKRDVDNENPTGAQFIATASANHATAAYRPLLKVTVSYSPLNLNHPLLDGCQSLWMIEEGMGDVLYDAVGTVHATLIGSPSWETTPDGDQAIQLAPATSYATAGDNYSFTGTAAMSVLCRFHIDSLPGSGNDRRMIAKEGSVSSNAVGWFLAHGGTNNQLTVNRWNNSGFSATGLNTGSALTAGTWYTGGFTYDGTTLKLYQDGVEENSTTTSVSTPSHTNPLRFALPSHYGSDGAQVTFDYIAIFDRALTADEVEDWHNLDLEDLLAKGAPPPFRRPYRVWTRRF